MIDKEPLIYKERERLVIKELCADIQKYMHGMFEYVYVQMKNPRTQQIMGAAFWNVDGKEDQEKQVLEFVDEIYKMLSTEKDTILEMLSI